MKQPSAVSGQQSAQELKIFQITETEWWAGYDGESVRAAFQQTIGEDADEQLAEFGVPEPIEDSDLDAFVVTDVDEAGQPKHTGREILADIAARGISVPCFVATTEY